MCIVQFSDYLPKWLPGQLSFSCSPSAALEPPSLCQLAPILQNTLLGEVAGVAGQNLAKDIHTTFPSPSDTSWLTNSADLVCPFDVCIYEAVSCNKLKWKIGKTQQYKGWGQSAKLGKHSAIWGKLGTALQAYALNPCTKFPPNPTSRKVKT